MLSIDPGVKYGMAVARWITGDLLFVWFEKITYNLPFTGDVVIETPEVIHGSTTKDILQLRDQTAEVGLLTRQRGCACFKYSPQQWKSSVPKPVHHARIWQALAPDERLAFAECAGKSVEWIYSYIQRAGLRLAQTGKIKGYSWKGHNLLDAVGIGLYHLRRVDNVGRPR